MLLQPWRSPLPLVSISRISSCCPHRTSNVPTSALSHLHNWGLEHGALRLHILTFPGMGCGSWRPHGGVPPPDVNPHYSFRFSRSLWQPSTSPPDGDHLTAPPLSLPKRPKHTAVGQMTQLQSRSSTFDLWCSGATYTYEHPYAWTWGLLWPLPVCARPDKLRSQARLQESFPNPGERGSCTKQTDTCQWLGFFELCHDVLLFEIF